MGYDGQILIMKKKFVNDMMELMQDATFSELYHDIGYTREYPNIFEFPKEEETRELVSVQYDVFTPFFKDKQLENDEARIIDEETWKVFRMYILDILQSFTLLDFADEKMSEEMADAYICVYKQMKKIKIDFMTECVVFTHNW